MEELLRELQQAMAAHRRALDEKPEPPAGLPERLAADDC